MHWLDLEAPEPERRRPFGDLRRALAARKAAIAAGLIAAPLAVMLYLLAAPPQYRAVARLAFAPAAAEAQTAPPTPFGEARLIASREFARRAADALDIGARPEFDPGRRPPPFVAALDFLGLATGPIGPDERMLEAFAARLGVRASQAGLDIAFRSRDPAFAAAAANRIAALYLEMRAEAGDGAASVTAPAVRPTRPLPPPGSVILAVAAAAAVAAGLGFGAARRAREPSPEPEAAEAPLEPPRAVGDAPRILRLGDPSLSQGGQSAASKRAADDDRDALGAVAARIVAARRDGAGLRIVGAALTPGADDADSMLALARRIGNSGRAILVRLDEPGAGADGPGVRDLIAGAASFAEAIRRDPRSRLHVIGAGGRAGDAFAPIDARELGGVVDALAATYDFIWLLAPPLEAGELAQALAAQADFFVLAAPAGPQGGAVARAGAMLRAAGAGVVLAVGAPLPAQRRLGQDAA